MNNIHVLVVGRNPEILNTIIRLINHKPEWSCTGALTDEEAVSAFTGQSFDIVLIGAGVSLGEKQKLCEIFNAQKPVVPIVQHYGGGSGLLFAEIYQALGLH